jgi:hypothetical protein
MIKIRPEERIILEVRRHWLTLLRNILLSSFLALLPFIALIALRQLGLSPTDFGLAPLAVFLTSSWLLMVWIFFYVAWTDYYLDVLVLTNERLIDVEQKGLFAREISELRIENIQDITVRIHGLLETLLDFGNLHIQTAASANEFIVQTIPHPDKVKDVILNRYDSLMQK